MSTNDIHQTSTPDADICGALRTKSGQPTTSGWHWIKDAAGKWQAVWVGCDIDGGNPSVCIPSDVPGRNWWRPVASITGEWGPRIPTPDEATPPAPAMATPWEERNAVSLEIARLKTPPAAVPVEIPRPENASGPMDLWGIAPDADTPPAERPTPITDRHRNRINSVIGEVVTSHVCEDLERLLAETREQRDRLADALRNIKAGLENEQAHGLWDAEDIIEAIINPALAAAKETEG